MYIVSLINVELTNEINKVINNIYFLINNFSELIKSIMRLKRKKDLIKFDLSPEKKTAIKTKKIRRLSMVLYLIELLFSCKISTTNKTKTK